MATLHIFENNEAAVFMYDSIIRITMKLLLFTSPLYMFWSMRFSAHGM
jgi:hypothetical protein